MHTYDLQIAELTRQRDALARVLLAVDTPEHNRAVIASNVDILDYTHGMEAMVDRLSARDYDPTQADLDLATEREIARRDEGTVRHA